MSLLVLGYRKDHGFHLDTLSLSLSEAKLPCCELPNREAHGGKELRETSIKQPVTARPMRHRGLQSSTREAADPANKYVSELGHRSSPS